jgi:serine protease AprX
MPRPSLVFCASTLSLLTTAVAQVVAGAIPAANATAQAAASEPLQFGVGDLLVRRWETPGGAKAAHSRDGGRTWQPLVDPDDRLHWVLAVYDPLREDHRLAGALGAPPQNRLFLVQFRTQVLAEYQDAVRGAGAEILHYLPENALFVRCDRGALAAVQALPCVRWVGDLQNGFKLDAALRAFVTGGGDTWQACNLVLAQKSDRARLVAQVQAAGGELVDACPGSVMVQAKLTPAQLLAVLAHDTVTYADPTTEVGFDMVNARIQGGANHVETLGGYRGTGVRAEITEAFEDTHPDFSGRVVLRSTGADSHGHCTAGIVGGNAMPVPAARGLMPDCTLIEGAYTNNHYAQIQDSVDPTLPWRSMLATASWGSLPTTAYTTISQAMDDALFDSDLTRLNSQSNQNSRNSRPEAWAKNVISGGGVAHGNDSNPANDTHTTASYGPADDGRIKPDICAYYDNVHTSDRSGPAGYNMSSGLAGNYYTGFSGTSAATPICAGFTGLIHEMFTDGLFGNPLPLPPLAANRFENKPHMTTSKALLCTTATPYPIAQVVREVQGWGFPNVQRLYDNRKEILVVDEYEALQQGQSRSYWVHVDPVAPYTDFRATMVYADPEAQAGALVHRVNDVDLKVTRFGDSTFWWGNNGLVGGNASTPGGSPDNRNTIESVYLPNPTPGIYIVTVTAVSVVVDGKVETPQLDVDFALVIHPIAGGSLNDTRMALDVTSTGPGDLGLSLTNVPTTGWTDGFTFVSFTTTRPLGFGNLFGFEADGLSTSIFLVPAAPGSVFHFTNTAGAYPYAPFTFDPGLVSSLAGLQLDFCVALWNGPNTFAVSNVERVLLQ